jgi:hypothetical protein
MIQNDKKQGKRNRYYIAVFTKPFTYKCFTYNHPGETVRDENQKKLFHFANPMPEVTCIAALRHLHQATHSFAHRAPVLQL